jgi:hypothetical protein
LYRLYRRVGVIAASVSPPRRCHHGCPLYRVLADGDRNAELSNANKSPPTIINHILLNPLYRVLAVARSGSSRGERERGREREKEREGGRERGGGGGGGREREIKGRASDQVQPWPPRQCVHARLDSAAMPASALHIADPVQPWPPPGAGTHAQCSHARPQAQAPTPSAAMAAPGRNPARA